MKAEGLLLDFASPCGAYKLTFEDDGKVAYAYLKGNGSIVGDVWLYNRCLTPDSPEWGDRSRIPFANPREFAASAGHVTRPGDVGDVLVEWEYESGSERPVAYVYVFEDLYGVVGVGDKPGYARHAIKSGRLARVMEIEA